ncbi:hypothetical protein MAPG_01823 [Magnaporthiopsis poae ATCC 64411]|uniref:Uncharacterized protein n=1 Tax=Magnaporthiopsis poae (strain ATCC 64411 / 73-15) TaxID=644358 RepID=A0A0C4DPQ2_MAGP6|nr:hypothetical protein MAPG_01823 [Magnaporthiopsis poae ATCC 64411]
MSSTTTNSTRTASATCSSPTETGCVQPMCNDRFKYPKWGGNSWLESNVVCSGRYRTDALAANATRRLAACCKVEESSLKLYNNIHSYMNLCGWSCNVTGYGTNTTAREMLDLLHCVKRAEDGNPPWEWGHGDDDIWPDPYAISCQSAFSSGAPPPRALSVSVLGVLVLLGTVILMG